MSDLPPVFSSEIPPDSAFDAAPSTDGSAVAAVPQIVVADPPRAVPLRLRPFLTWCHPLAAFGWVFFGFGLIFVTVFGQVADWSAWTENWRAAERVTGRVDRVHATTSSVNNARVWQIDYTYWTPGGQTRQGSSFAHGRNFAAGDRVQVEYPPTRPDISRIVGTQRGAFPAWVILLTCIFPLVGAGFVIGSILYGHGRVRFLRDGAAAWGVLQSCTATSMRVNERPVYKLAFAYQNAAGQACVAETRSLHPEQFPANVPALLLCDPARPTRALVVADTGAGVGFDANGELTTSASAARYLLLLPAIATILGHGFYWATRLAR